MRSGIIMSLHKFGFNKKTQMGIRTYFVVISIIISTVLLSTSLSHNNQPQQTYNFPEQAEPNQQSTRQIASTHVIFVEDFFIELEFV